MPPATTPFSLWTFSVLLAVFLLSLAVLLWLMHRWTRGRDRQRLLDWATSFSASPTRSVPTPLLGTAAQFRVVTAFASDTTFAAHLRSHRTPASRSPNAHSDWHLLAIRLPFDPGFAGLRPSAAHTCLVDLFSIVGEQPPSPPPSSSPTTPTHTSPSAIRLLSYPSLPLPGDTPDAPAPFTLFAESPSAAAYLQSSPLPHKLPPDLALLLRDQWLILDLSPRPFTPPSLQQALTLAHLLAQSLPPPPHPST